MANASKYSGMGARLFGNECSLRVWAPNARRVRVEGDFTNWSAGAIDLYGEGNGNWSSDVSPVQPGQRYKYIIDNAGGPFNDASHPWERADARALQVENSGAAAAGYVLAPASGYPYAPFTTPGFENFILYQMHVGSFVGLNDQTHVPGRISRFVDVIEKLSYVRDLGFNAIALLPIGSYYGDFNLGYGTSDHFAPEDSYGTSNDRAADELRRLVDQAHRHGLAVIFDVVYNHGAPNDDRYWQYDGNYRGGGGIYYESGHNTSYGSGYAMWRSEVRDFFLDNARMFLSDYRADGLRFDAVQFIPDDALRYILWNLRRDYPDKYLIAEYNAGDSESAFSYRDPYGDLGFRAVWTLDEPQRFKDAIDGVDPVNRIKGLIGWWSGGHSAWNLVRYLTGSHDQIKDETYNSNPSGGRYLIERFGGRDNGWARAKVRLGWALNVALPGTPMIFMGTEGHMWGYWSVKLDGNGEHRFNWAIVGDPTGIPMQRMVRDINNMRWANPALRSENLEPVHDDYQGQVVAFKRWTYDGNIVLVVVSVGNNQWSNGDYGVNMGGETGMWREIFNSQAPEYGGMGTTGNFQIDRQVARDGKLYINLSAWAVVLFRKL